MSSPERSSTETQTASPARSRRFPLPLAIIYALTLASGALYLAFRRFPAFADAWNGTVAATLRQVLAYATLLFPFSLAETLLIALPAILAFLIYCGIRYHNETLRDALVYCGSVLAVLCIVLQLFALAFAPGYSAAPLDKKLGIDRKDVSARELYDTARILIDEIDALSAEVLFVQDGFSVMPYTLYTMNAKLTEAYETAAEQYEAIATFPSFAKPVALSEAMSYTHITGVYSFFTGEANLNVNFPDYTLPYTAAHELAHQRGFAREDEANFIAFLVCIGSEDAYLRYSGYVGMYEYVMSALYRADKELYAEARSYVPTAVLKEQRAYSEFFAKYQHSKVGEVSGAINNSYLQSQGTVGTRSYGMVVDLTVAYYKKK